MYCFRFPNQATFRALAAAAGYVTTDEEGNEVLITGGHGWALDEIGVITEGGEYDPETGEVITPPTALDGWHVNLAAADAPEAWDDYLVIVNTPARVFFGGPTQAPPTDVLEEIAA